MPRRRPIALLLTPPLLMVTMGLGACAGSNAPKTSNTGATEVRASLNAVERSSLRERAIEVLEEAAFNEWALLRANAIEGLALAPSRAGGVVRAGLADENEGVRSIAATLAGRLRLVDTAPTLRALTEDPSPLVRIGAITGLALMEEDVDQTPLASLLEHHRADVRSLAAFALGEIGNASAVPLLRAAVRGKAGTSAGVQGAIFRMQAGEAQVKLGDADAVNALRAGLYPSSTEEVEAALLAVQILGELGDRESAKQLVEIIEFERGDTPGGATRSRVDWLYPPELRLAAATSLVKMGYSPRGYVGTGFEQDPNPMIRAQVAFLYGEIGDGQFLARLQTLMNDPEPVVRVAAAGAVVQAMQQR